MEKKGIQTNIGNLNRDIRAANSLMQSIRQMVRHLKGWIADLKEKKAVLLEALEQAKEPTLPELLFQYLELRSLSLIHICSVCCSGCSLGAGSALENRLPPG